MLSQCWVLLCNRRNTVGNVDGARFMAKLRGSGFNLQTMEHRLNLGSNGRQVTAGAASPTVSRTRRLLGVLGVDTLFSEYQGLTCMLLIQQTDSAFVSLLSLPDKRDLSSCLLPFVCSAD